MSLEQVAIDTDRLIGAASTHKHAYAVVAAAETDLLRQLWAVAFDRDLRNLRDLVAIELDRREGGVR